MRVTARTVRTALGVACYSGLLVMAFSMLFSWSATAQVMQSSNYQIEFDSVNVGGNRSVSGSYIIEDTTGEIATGPSGSATYQLRAGYQQMNENYLSMTAPGDVTLTPSIGGVTGGTANGSAAVTVTTDSLAGYQLTIRASSSPAMNHTATSATIADYTPAGDPDYTFTVNAGEALFGFTPEGTDIASAFLNNGSNVCALGSSDDPDACWDGLTTGDTTVALRTGSNHPGGTVTTLKFRVGVDPAANPVGGLYRATTTLTALSL